MNLKFNCKLKLKIREKSEAEQLIPKKKSAFSEFLHKKKRRKGCGENQGAGFINEIIPVSTV